LEENNLGSKKRNAKIGKYKSRIVSHINCELNKMVKEGSIKRPAVSRVTKFRIS